MLSIWLMLPYCGYGGVVGAGDLASRRIGVDAGSCLVDIQQAQQVTCLAADIADLRDDIRARGFARC